MSQEPINDKAIKELVALGKQCGEVRTVTGGNIPFVIVPNDSKLQAVPELMWNEHNRAPERIKQTVSVHDPASFVDYYRLFSDENSRVFADEITSRVLGVLDYHGALDGGSPRWGAHKLILALQLSPEWKTWFEHNNKQMDQETFAQFLEQYAMDIIHPSPGSIKDMASDLEGTVGVEFGAGVRMESGQRKFKYVETTKTTTGGGEITVPDRFTLSIPVYVGGERISMEVLLRFRINGGAITFFYTLVRPEMVKRDAFILSRDSIARELGVKIINGSLPA